MAIMVGTHSSLTALLRFSAAAAAAAAASLALLPTIASASGDFIDQDLRNLTVVKSPINPDITISYKEPKGACNLALDTQRQITGWVNVPGEKYPINLFFWFVEAREDTDLLSVWLNGGPGSSSMYGFFTGAGPCEVVEEGRRLTTKAREWGWDRASNMLFIDQPNQVGFSYDTATEGTGHMFMDGEYVTPPVSADSFPRFGNDWLAYNGTFSTNNDSSTANTTAAAAEAVYHLMQGFLAAFPKYNPPDEEPLGINLFAESYGGKYAPIFASKWAEMNEARDSGEISKSETVELDLRSVGIVNGCVDDIVQAPYYPIYLYKNPYGVELIGEETFTRANESFSSDGGCKDALEKCRQKVAELDPDHDGDSSEAAGYCVLADSVCSELANFYLDLDPPLSWYDISAEDPSPFPPVWYTEYVQTGGFNEAVGAATNFTQSSSAVWSGFASTGDFEMTAPIPMLAELVKSGIRVTLLYGDRDFICNWMGGEAVSLAIAEAAGEEYSGGKFADAGYADIQTNDSYVGGAVRQLGNLSFARVYQSGHALPSYQPETTFQLFARAVLGTAMDSGAEVDLSSFKTAGSGEADKQLELPGSPEPICWVRSAFETCTEEHLNALNEQTGVLINGVHYADESDWKGGSSTGEEEPSKTMTGGIYTGTATSEDGDSESGDGGDDNENSAVGLLAAKNVVIAVMVGVLGFVLG
ncbi:Carboxypeptidase S1-like protein B [Zalerion maritima]|uniref:Carboxypeptidase n=1 Tax=Zalerion maritima TaxID=339359 RepID=A0AAD5RRM2_9PEZI|nr:Carboxypeptidase S1-like protein B [Zalerion maritima]